MAHLGARLMAVRDGEVDIELDYAPHLTQHHGFLHAGVTTAICDSACGYAALTNAGFHLKMRSALNLRSICSRPPWVSAFGPRAGW